MRREVQEDFTQRRGGAEARRRRKSCSRRGAEGAEDLGWAAKRFVVAGSGVAAAVGDKGGFAAWLLCDLCASARTLFFLSSASPRLRVSA